MRLTAYLWTGSGSPPPEYLDLILCRDIFHCTPSELYQEDARIVTMMLRLAAVEARIREAKSSSSKSAAASARLRGK